MSTTPSRFTPRLGFLALLVPTMLCASSVPAPDHTFYGLPTSNGALLEAGEVVLRRPDDSLVLARYRLGEQPEHGGRYVLRVPMELGPTVTSAATRTGDPIEIYVDGTLAGEGAVGDPGESTSLNIDLYYTQPPELWISAPPVTEGNSGAFPADLTVHLSRAVAWDVSVSWGTADGTAVAGLDYAAGSGSVVIPGGETEAMLAVLVTGDTEPEPTETFFVNLSNPVGAVFRPVPLGSTVAVEIGPDDVEWLASVEDTQTIEGDGESSGSVRVVLDEGLPSLTEFVVDIDWELVAGTATPGGDFELATGVLSIDAQALCPEVGAPCAYIPVALLGDDVREGNENLLVRLTGISTGSIERAEATVTIVDDERYLRYLGVDVAAPPAVEGLAEPSAVALSSDGASLYVASSVDDAVSVFARNPTSGDLTYVEVKRGEVAGILGLDGASGVAVSPDGANVYVTGLFSDSVTVFDRNAATGALTYREVHRQGIGGVSGLDGATAVAISPDGEHVYTAARNSNSIAVFDRAPATGALTFTGPPVSNGNGASFIQGANALAFSASGSHLFLTAATDSTLSVFSRNPATGALTVLDTERDGINDPSDTAGLVDGLNGARALVVSPDDLAIYVAGELESSIAVFTFDSALGELRFLERKQNGLGGVSGLEQVAALAIHPNGRYLYAAARGGEAVTTFRRETNHRLTWYESRHNGELEEMPDVVVEGLRGAVAMAAVPGSADHLFVVSQLDAAVSTFEPDNDAPLAPVAMSTSHTAGEFSQEQEIAFEWSGARDLGVGIAGYSYEVDGSASTTVTPPIEMPHGVDPHTLTTPTLADGLWYFHLATCDTIDNCATLHLGPYGIDTTAPLAPTDLVKTNQPEITIEVAWTTAIDPGAQPSGIAGYIHLFTQEAVGSCTGAVTLPASATSVSSGPVADGFWYFHICAVDNVGLRSPIATLGPVVADSGLPLLIDRVTAVAPPADDSVEGPELLGMTQLRLDFNRPVALEGPGNGFDLENYLLVELGPDATSDTSDCTVAGGDDVAVAVEEAVWIETANQLYLRLAESRAVPAGRYALRVCDSLVDYTDDALDGDDDGTDGGDFMRSFEIGSSNLLANPNIDRGTDGWTLSSGVDIFAQSLDVHSTPTSGSLRLQNDFGGPDAQLEVSQCVPGDQNSVYGLSALARVDNSDGGEVTMSAIVRAYGLPGCSGPPSEVILESSSIETDTGGSWVAIGLENVTLRDFLILSPQGFFEVRFGVGVGSVAVESWVGVDLDELVFSATIGSIFKSGFETGNTAEWSSSVP